VESDVHHQQMTQAAHLVLLQLPQLQSLCHGGPHHRFIQQQLLVGVGPVNPAGHLITQLEAPQLHKCPALHLQTRAANKKVAGSLQSGTLERQHFTPQLESHSCTQAPPCTRSRQKKHNVLQSQLLVDVRLVSPARHLITQLEAPQLHK
jgi:hypothetical protein